MLQHPKSLDTHSQQTQTHHTQNLERTHGYIANIGTQHIQDTLIQKQT